MHKTEALQAAVGMALRAIPNRLAGKGLAASQELCNNHSAVCVSDDYGNNLLCPSLNEPIAASLFSNGVYEPDTLAAILARLRPSGVFLDVGANIGAIALPIAATRPDVRVICVEAAPQVASVLRRNVTENGRTGVIVVECLVGAQSISDVPFYLALSKDSWAYFHWPSVWVRADLDRAANAR